MTSKSRFALLVPLCLLLLSGCGSKKKGTLSGKVTYNGNPVTGGTIEFSPEEGGSFSGVISPEGTYSVGQIPKGDYTVTVETESINPKTKRLSPQDYQSQKGRRPSTGGAPKGSPPPQVSSPRPPGLEEAPSQGEYKPIPKKYEDKKTSPLKITVTGGSQKEDLTLEGPLEKGR